jgi:8-oxo-dGTP pyrophosphatase MutT (NUDIX family)
MAFTKVHDGISDPFSKSGFFATRKMTPPSSELPGCQQVAAVCYRVHDSAIEFLLVQTRGGRWTFPKGNVEPGMTCAQVAALEAYEEAGVHGSVELAPFARYTYRKRRSRDNAFAIHAHLCHVHRVHSPQEANRNPRWFSSDKAKRRLHRERDFEDAAELARVVDRAVMRIARLRRAANAAADPIQNVRFDVFEVAGIPGAAQPASIHRYLRKEGARSALSTSPVAGLLTGKVESTRTKLIEIDGRQRARRGTRSHR